MTEMKKLILSIAVLFMSGCANNNFAWYKADGTQEMFSQDRYACLQQTQQPTSTAYYGNYGGLLQSKQYTASSGMATNSPLYTACMNSRGWTWRDQTAAQNSNSAPNPQVQSGRDSAAAIIARMGALCSKAEYAPYFSKTFCASPDASLALMTDKNKINNAERAALNAWSQEYDKLFIELNAISTKQGNENDKKIVRYRETVAQPAAQKNRLDLYDGKITWGDYNRRRKDINDAMAVEQKRILQ